MARQIIQLVCLLPLGACDGGDVLPHGIDDPDGLVDAVAVAPDFEFQAQVQLDVGGVWSIPVWDGE